MYAEAQFNEHSQVLKISDLYPSAYIAHPDFYQEVEGEIKDGGLAFPLVVVHSTVQHWRETWVSALIPPPTNLDPRDMVYWLACGNNRYYILKDLGYTTVDCIVVGEFKEANQYCWSQRKWQNDRHGRRTRGRI